MERSITQNDIDRADHQRKENRESELLRGDAISNTLKAGIDLERSANNNKLTTAIAGIRSAWHTLYLVIPGLNADGLKAMDLLATTYKQVTGENIR